MNAANSSDGTPEAKSWARAEELFAELVELDPAACEQRLLELRTDEPEVVAWVERLLRADLELEQRERSKEGARDRQTDFLAPRRDLALDWVGGGEHDEAEAAVDGLLDPAARFSLHAGDEVGPFVIEGGIGRGGMGEVYRARRRESIDESGFEQTVALKLIRPVDGGPTEEIRQRFYRERRILARLTHPAIGRLLDGGTAPDGRPYFAMELVDGEPITDFCSSRETSLRRRLELFGEVCAAVQFAHENLVVHRDLKPSNVLVVEPSTRSGSGRSLPSVKLLDFGIAGLLEAEPEGVLTRTGMAPATPQYAAPEQLRGEPVQASTDVYSLGILLFELIAGERPEEWPPRTPSDAHRAPPSPAKIAAETGRECPRDLAAIVMRAIEIEPERRYRSVAAMAEDLDRFLDGRAVRAQQGTGWYRARKFLLRNRVAVALGSLAVLALLVGLVVARTQAEEASRQAELARRSTELLTQVFEGSDPAATRGREVSALDLLDAGAAQIAADLDDDPALRAELQTVLARIYRSLGSYEAARELAGEALVAADASRDDGLRASARLELARSELALGRPASAIELLEPEMPSRRNPEAKLGVDLQTAYASALLELGRAEDALAVTSTLESVPLVEASVERQARVLGLQADALAALGRPRDAVAVHRRVVALLSEAFESPHPVLARAWSDLGVALQSIAAHDEAAQIERRALDARRELYGDRHPEVADSLRNLSGSERALGRGAEGRNLLEEAVAIYGETLGPNHPETAESINNLAVATVQGGDLQGAVPLFEQAVRVIRVAFGSEHPSLILPLASLGNLLSSLGRLDRAQEVLDEARVLSADLLPEGHPQRALVANQLAGLRARQGRQAEAIPLLQEALDGFRASLGPDHPNVGIVLATLGRLEIEVGGSAADSLASATAHLEEAVDLLEKAPAPLRAHYVRALAGLGEAWFLTGREDDAVEAWQRSVAESERIGVEARTGACVAARVVRERFGSVTALDDRSDSWTRAVRQLAVERDDCD